MLYGPYNISKHLKALLRKEKQMSSEHTEIRKLVQNNRFFPSYIR